MRHRRMPTASGDVMLDGKVEMAGQRGVGARVGQLVSVSVQGLCLTRGGSVANDVTLRADFGIALWLSGVAALISHENRHRLVARSGR